MKKLLLATLIVLNCCVMAPAEDKEIDWEGLGKAFEGILLGLGTALDVTAAELSAADCFHKVAQDSSLTTEQKVEQADICEANAKKQIEEIQNSEEFKRLEQISKELK